MVGRYALCYCFKYSWRFCSVYKRASKSGIMGFGKVEHYTVRKCIILSWNASLHNIIQSCGLVPLTLAYVIYILWPPGTKE